jgi:hypothetical protein
MLKNNSTILLCIFIFILSFTLTQAQASLYIDQYPKQTKEDEPVYFTLKGDDYNLEKVNVTWKVDGAIIDEGIGRTTFKYTAPKLNKQKKIIAIIDDSSSQQSFVELILETTPYTLLYEGKDTYVPPFYKGRAMPVKEGQVRLGIISFSDEIGVDWRVDRNVLKDKNKLTILNSKLTDNKLKIEADIFKGENLKANLVKNINLKNPEMYLKVKDRDTGAYREPLGVEQGGEIEVKTEAYYVSAIKKVDPTLRLLWSINGIKQMVKDPWMVKFTSNSGKKESIKAKVELKQIEKITQTAEKSLNIIFE